MNVVRILPFFGLLIVSGCTDKPEDHINEAMANYMRGQLIPDKVVINKASCSDGIPRGSNKTYNCRITFTSTDVTGIKRTMDISPILINEAGNWHFMR